MSQKRNNLRIFIERPNTKVHIFFKMHLNHKKINKTLQEKKNQTIKIPIKFFIMEKKYTY